MNRLLIIGGLCLSVSIGCSSKPQLPSSSQAIPTAPLRALFIPVENPVLELCTDDTHSRTEWFNHPVARFSDMGIDLNGRAVTGKGLREWATKYYERKVERVLWVQIAPNSIGNAEHELEPLLRMFPDLYVRQVEFGFTCPRIRR